MKLVVVVWIAVWATSSKTLNVKATTSTINRINRVTDLVLPILSLIPLSSFVLSSYDSFQLNSIFNIFIHLTSLKSKIVLKRSKKGEQKSNSYYSKRKVAKTPGCWDRLPASSILGTSKEWFPQGTGVLGRRDQVDVYGARGIASWWLPSFKILKKLQQLEFKIFEASHHK